MDEQAQDLTPILPSNIKLLHPLHTTTPPEYSPHAHRRKRETQSPNHLTQHSHHANHRLPFTAHENDSSRSDSAGAEEEPALDDMTMVRSKVPLMPGDESPTFSGDFGAPPLDARQGSDDSDGGAAVRAFLERESPLVHEDDVGLGRNITPMLTEDYLSSEPRHTVLDEIVTHNGANNLDLETNAAGNRVDATIGATSETHHNNQPPSRTKSNNLPPAARPHSFGGTGPDSPRRSLARVGGRISPIPTSRQTPPLRLGKLSDAAKPEAKTSLGIRDNKLTRLSVQVSPRLASSNSATPLVRRSSVARSTSLAGSMRKEGSTPPSSNGSAAPLSPRPKLRTSKTETDLRSPRRGVRPSTPIPLQQLTTVAASLSQYGYAWGLGASLSLRLTATLENPDLRFIIVHVSPDRGVGDPVTVSEPFDGASPNISPDWRVHFAVYKRRVDVRGIVLCEAPLAAAMASALASSSEHELSASVLHSAIHEFLPSSRPSITLASCTRGSQRADGAEVVEKLGGASVVLVEGVGALCVAESREGDGVTSAVERAILNVKRLEGACGVWLRGGRYAGL